MIDNITQNISSYDRVNRLFLNLIAKEEPDEFLTTTLYNEL